MSVAPVPPVPPAPPSASDRPGVSAGRQAKAASFDRTLERALAEAADTGDQGKLLAEVLRLQLMRTTVFLDLDGGEEADPLLSSMLPNFSLAGRNFDLPAPSPSESRSVVRSSEPPSSLDAIVSKASRRYNVAPELVRAVIRAESGFNPQAVSPAGAQGLMQLMPETARGLGVSNSFDPEQNVMGGTRYLRQMLDRYDGNLERALAAYNWGPGNLDRSDGSLPRETRAYIARIKGFLAKES